MQWDCLVRRGGMTNDINYKSTIIQKRQFEMHPLLLVANYKVRFVGKGLPFFGRDYIHLGLKCIPTTCD